MRVNPDDHYNELNWFKLSSPPQLLPKDLLRHSRTISGVEVDKHIEKMLSIPADYKSSSGEVFLVAGDSLEINKQLMLSAGGNATVTHFSRTYQPLSRTTTYTVTYDVFEQ